MSSVISTMKLQIDLSKILNISSSVISRIKGEKIDTGTSELIDEVIGELMVSIETSNQLH